MTGADRPRLPWFRVRAEADLERLTGWVKTHKTGGANTFGCPRPDRNGDWICSLGRAKNPDSDWSRYQGHTAMIWFATEELADKADPYIRKGLGWPVEDATT